MPDRESVITHLQIINTWAEFARERDLQFFTAKHLEDIAKWSDDAIALLKEQEPIGWISVKDRVPEEHPSIFASCYGTEKWTNGMWRNESDRVLVTILFPDGTRTVDKGKLQDGTWKTGVSPVLPQVVTHWAMWPEPPKEENGDATD